MEKHEIALTDRYVLQNKIVERYLKGESAEKIAKALGMRRVDVKEHIQEWQEVARNTVVIQDRARSAILDLDERYNNILDETWSAIQDAENMNDYKTKGTLLKNVAEIEAKRVDVLQKAGLLDDAALGDQIAETEEKIEVMKKIIKEVVNDCPKCRGEVAKRLRQMGDEEPIVVSAEQADYEVHDH